MDGNIAVKGNLSTRVIHAPGPSLAWKLSNWLRWPMLKSLVAVFIINPIANWFGLMTAYGKLEILHIKATGERINYGVVSYRLVTNAFVAFVVDQLQTETSVFGDFKYHDGGVGVTAANAADTAIETTDGESRATGTQTESSAPVYVSVGTIAYTTTKAVTEHAIFNDATTGTMMDHHVFAAINVVNGDSIQSTFSLTLTGG